MKTFMRYLRYRLDSTTLRTLVFTVISVMLSLSVITSCIDVEEMQYAETGIYVLAVVLGIVCTLIPILFGLCHNSLQQRAMLIHI